MVNRKKLVRGANDMRMLDLFSGIGGFHLGFEQAGFEFEWVGFSEIDKYASSVYRHRFPGAKELGDVKSVRPERDLPDHIDILCGGFPCQAFSVAGKRKGFEDTRGTLFFEIARILRHYKETKKPIDYFVLENVKGLLSHEDGRTFAVIYGVLADLGYTIECQLLNTRWFLPQNRERIYIVGHLRSGSGPKVFPIGDTNQQNRKLEKPGQSIRSHSRCLTSPNNPKNHSGMQLVKYNISNASERERSFKDVSPALLGRDYKDPKLVKVINKQGSKKNNQDYAATLLGGGHSGGNHSDMDLLEIADYRNDEGLRVRKDKVSPTLATRKHSKTDISTMPPLLIQNDVKIKTVQPVLTPDRGKKRQNGRRMKEDGEPMFTLNATDQHGVKIEYGSKALNETLEQNKLKKDDVKALDLYNRKAQDHAPTLTDPQHANLRLYEKSKIRRLTPVECEKLQGFPVDWTSEGEMNGKVVKMSDTQRYKQCGNAVTVDVVQVVAEKIRLLKC